MDRAINDATLKKIGDIFQYFIALRDCFSMKSGDKLQIETNGDVSIIAELSNNSFQREVKHHFGKRILSDRDVDFWKTLSNWYREYNRIHMFSDLILYTTAAISIKSPFKEWNEKKPPEKLLTLKTIGSIMKDKEKIFREYYDSIFDVNTYDEKKLLNILAKFTIESQQNKISEISKEFSCYIGHIPENNRSPYIAALLGQIIDIVKEPPHKWEVTRENFDKMLQQTSPGYSNPKERPLPSEFAEAHIPEAEAVLLEQKKFVTAIRHIDYEAQIPNAVSDYWKAEMTVIRYLKDDLLYVRSLPRYKNELKTQLKYTKDSKKLEAENTDRNTQIRYSKLMYNQIMAWDAKDFESIIRNQGYFQRGIIHTIVDDDKFNWDVGEKDEY